MTIHHLSREHVALNQFISFAKWLPIVPLAGSGRQLCPVFIDDVARLAADSLRSRLKVAARPLQLLRTPRRLTPLAEGLETYLGHDACGKR